MEYFQPAINGRVLPASHGRMGTANDVTINITGPVNANNKYDVMNLANLISAKVEAGDNQRSLGQNGPDVFCDAGSFLRWLQEPLNSPTE